MILIGDTYVQRPDPDSVFAPNEHLFRDADIFFCNLETVVAEEQDLPKYDTRRGFPRTDEANLKAYSRAGINVVNVANNPIMYHGRDCFVRTIEALERAGLAYGGGGRNIAEARRIACVEASGTKVAFVCRTCVGLTDAGATEDLPGVARFRVTTVFEPRARHFEVPGSPPIIRTLPEEADGDALAEDIQRAKREADLVVVSWHWGVSRASGGDGRLVSYQVDLGHLSIDAGADLVIGHHPHVLQPIEVYNGRVIAYSLGNYCHDMTRQSVDTMLLQCSISEGSVREVSFVPGRIDSGGPPEFFEPQNARRIIDHLRQISMPFGTQFDERDSAVSIRIDR